jgi:tetratricopeptide (TPR) repeat protein
MARSSKLLVRVNTALSRSRYADAIKTAAAASIPKLEGDELSALMDAMLNAAAGLSDGSDAELQAYNLVITCADQLAADPQFKPSVELRVNAALFNKGVVLAQLGRNEQAIDAYDRLVNRVGGSSELGLRENAVRALFNKGASLQGLERREEAIAVFDDLIGEYEDDADPIVREAVGKALVNKGIALAELNRTTEAMDVLDDVITRWEDSIDPVLRERAARAYINKAGALIQIGRRDDARHTYEEAIELFGKDTEMLLREQAAIAQVRKDILEDAI